MKIKQLLIIFSIFGTLMSCNTSNKIIVNRKIIDTQGEPMLIGRVNKEAFTAPEFDSWYSNEYNAYIPNHNIIKRLKGRARIYRVEVFLGTWCSDTHEQVPRFLKILDEIKYPEKNIALYAVNRKKESFYGEQAQKAIFNIPTFIIYKGRREIGRIIESPTETLESDLYKIITGKKFDANKNSEKKDRNNVKKKGKTTKKIKKDNS